MSNSWPDMAWRCPVVTESEVTAFEDRIGHRLPDDYRSFLLEVNGGRLGTHTVFVDGSLNMLFGLNAPDERDDLLSWALNERSRSQLPNRDLLFVGYDDGGRPILLGLAGEHRGEVWLENTSDPRPEDANPRVEWFKRRDMWKLAGSFQEFMNSLKPF